MIAVGRHHLRLGQEALLDLVSRNIQLYAFGKAFLLQLHTHNLHLHPPCALTAQLCSNEKRPRRPTFPTVALFVLGCRSGDDLFLCHLTSLSCDICRNHPGGAEAESQNHST